MSPRVLIFLLCIFFLPTRQYAQNSESLPQKPPITYAAREVADIASRSIVVLITIDDKGKPLSLGTGFFVSKSLIVTNYHVIADASRIKARTIHPSSVIEVAKIRYEDVANDLAVLEVVGEVGDYLCLGNSDQVAVGDDVYTYGNPEGLVGTFSKGMVSALRGSSFIQITAPISNGSSGGPVLNSRAEVIGIATKSVAEGQNLNFAVPGNRLNGVIEALKNSDLSFGAVTRAPRSFNEGLHVPREGQADPPKTEVEPSFEETASFLSRKVTGQSLVTRSGAIYKVKAFDFLPCQAKWSITFDNNGGEYAFAYTPSLRFARNAWVGGDDGIQAFVVWVEFNNPFTLNKQFTLRGRSNPVEQEKQTKIMVPIGFDEELAQRTARALNHAFKLCGGGEVKEPF